MSKLLLTLFVLATTFSDLSAIIEVSSKQITITDGLANSTVRHFFQDSKGFIWMGTLNGLNRYDGNSFVSYYPTADNPLSLADQKIYELSEDANGHLWIQFSSELFSCYDLKHSCFVDFTGNKEFRQKYSHKIFTSNGDTWLWHDGNGARRVIYQNDSFRSVIYKKQYNNLLSDNVRFVSEGYEGDIWIGTAKGLIKITDEKEQVIDNNSDFHHMISYKDNAYFLSNNNRLYIYDKSQTQLKQLAEFPSSQTATGYFLLDNQWIILTSSGIYSYNFAEKKLVFNPELFPAKIESGNVTIDNKSNIWIYNHTGEVTYINRESGELKTFRLFPPEKMRYIDLERYRIVHDSRNIIWISTYGNGLFAYDIRKDELNHFRAQLDQYTPVNSNYLLDIMEDRSGGIWVSSEFSGINRISVINEGSYRYFPEDPNLLDRSNTIRMVSKMHNGEIWIGTRQGGLYIYDSDFKLKSSRKNFHSNIYAVEKDADGKVWMGSRGDGLNIDNIWYKNDPSDPTSISNNNIFSIYRDRKNRMWIGTFGGGLDLALKENNGYRFRHFLTSSYSQRLIRSICEDQNGMIWVGTSNGIYIFDPDSLMTDPENYYLYNYTNGGLLSNEVKYLFPDSKGNIWVATSGSGFSICTLKDNYDLLTFEHYGTKDGLANDIVQTIVEDKYGRIWLSTEYGISKFIHSDKYFENYFFSTYPLGNIYTENSICQCDDGKILFGSNHGFIVFDPELVKKSDYTSPVVFTNINVNGMNLLPEDKDSPLIKSLAYSEEVILKHFQNSFVVDFSSFNYAETDHTKYMYKLTNYDKLWSTPSSLPSASYKMLPPGNYELQVKSSNSAGVWNDDISILTLRITPPFYLTGWAFLFYFIFIITGLYIGYRITRNFYSLNNKVSVEKQLTEYKLVFFTNISHEFRTPLTLIQGALERIKRSNSTSKELSYPLQTMEKSTQRMLKLIDQLLEFRKMQNNKLALSLEKTDVIAMLYEIFLSFNDMAESKNIDFQFIPSITSYKMFIDKGKLDKMIYNLLSNSFKYTPQSGTIVLSVTPNADTEELEIKVKDTGVGIPKEKQKELFKRFMQSSFSGESVGIGLHLVHELVQVHKGQINFTENETGGSIFTITLPLQTNFYEEKDFLIVNNLLLQEKQKSNFLEKEDLSSIIKSIPLNKQKVLIIEDDNDVRQYLKEELNSYFQLVIAYDGVTGFELAQNESPDLIVCDVLMPGMNGYEVTRKLKSDFHTSHIPIILLTALGLPENHLEGIESGAEAYISKPFSIRLLLTRIIKILEQRERLKEKFSEEPGIMRSVVYASDRDKEFADEIQRILEINLENVDFSIDEFASKMNLGRTAFYKKVKGITGYSPNEYLRIMRMKKAAELLIEGKLTVSEVSYKVGIDDPFYFSKCFKSQFGVTPSSYLKGKPEE